MIKKGLNLAEIPTITIHLCAPNDTNGNPRRLFLCLDKKMGDVVAVFNEGYSGVPEACKGAGKTQGPRIEITPAEYRSWVKYGREISGEI